MGVIGEPTGPGRWVFSLQKLGPFWDHLHDRTSESLSRLAAFFFSSWGAKLVFKISRISHHKIKDKKHLHNFNLKKIFSKQSLFDRDHYIYMGVSENNGTPKSSILIGFSIINHPFGVPPFSETRIYIYIPCFFFCSLASLWDTSQKHHHLLKRCMIESFENTISSRLETPGSQPKACWGNSRFHSEAIDYTSCSICMGFLHQNYGYHESIKFDTPKMDQWTLGTYLVGGWTNPFEKHSSDWIISPGIGVKIKNMRKHHLVYPIVLQIPFRVVFRP